jgi:hypothetical protein
MVLSGAITTVGKFPMGDPTKDPQDSSVAFMVWVTIALIGLAIVSLALGISPDSGDLSLMP